VTSEEQNELDRLKRETWLCDLSNRAPSGTTLQRLAHLEAQAEMEWWKRVENQDV